ncbi:MAG: oligoendopeptidase F family protein, partial [Chloroflexi bacterium]|nr:oligoendopeptidase F family protein [Chloroflexota bacterium]
MLIPNRSQVPTADTWDLASVFPTVQDWEAALLDLADQLRALRRFEGHLSDGPTVLADWFTASERAEHLLGRIYIYAGESYAVDTTNQEAGALESRALSLVAEAEAATAFAEPEMLAIGIATLRAWIRSEPRLAIYAHYFDELERQQPHIRSGEVEELLGQASDAFASATATHGILAEADMTFAPAWTSAPASEALPVAQGTMDALLVHTDRKVRRTAYESYADAHIAVKNAMANCMLTGVKQHVLQARARRYSSALEASLGSNYIPTHIYHNVIDAFRRNLPIWHRYWRVRREALGYDTLYEYDIKAPLVAQPPAIPWQRAVDLICEGLRPLGSEYVDTLRRGVLAQRWVDWRPNQGKRSGAFSTGVPGTHPFILMSYTDDIYGLSTLAHELGHSMHSLQTWTHQPFIYAHYVIFCAEVASN